MLEFVSVIQMKFSFEVLPRKFVNTFTVMGGSHLVVITTPFEGTEFGYLSWTASCIYQYATIGINASDIYCRIWKVRSGKIIHINVEKLQVTSALFL